MMMKSMKRVALLGMVATMFGAGTMAQAETRLTGAGATFPNPIYQRWVTEYQKANPDVQINYQSIGSGGGIKGITEKTVDFAGSDAPMSKKERAAAGGEIVHIPTVAGAVVAAYNLPDVKGDVKLTGEMLADIYLGKITKWSDPRIAELNDGVKLPETTITPVYRTDGSGTTFVFTNYLTTQSEAFKGSIGAGKQVQFKLGQGGKGSEGVSAVVQGTPGAIGYVEHNYAEQNHIPFALLKNKAGKFVKASAQSVSAAGAGAVDQMKESLAVDIWNQGGDEAYPISAFTYILVYKDLGCLKDAGKAKALVGFLNWATTDGQSLAADMSYAPLAGSVQEKAKAAIGSLTWEGKAVKAVAAAK